MLKVECHPPHNIQRIACDLMEPWMSQKYFLGNITIL